ncbi:MAG TPA: histidine--tRNA ligase [Planctomycetota bacterium]|nr:histidine--tRNA ligase [Planctomycetota bacterium]
MARDVHTSPVRGMRDLLPQECELRDWAVGVILDTYRRFGFQRVETPALEHLSLLTGGDGGENEKLIFKVLKRGDELRNGAMKWRAKLTNLQDATEQTPAAASPSSDENDLVDAGLRYDLTVPLARFYAEHQAELPTPFKSIQIGPVWRAERPQKGRFRQFTQCDIDVLGEAGESAEIDLILATTEALSALGLAHFTVRINDRRLLQDYARRCGVAEEKRDGFFITLDKLDKISAEAAAAELVALGLSSDAARDAVTGLVTQRENASLASFAPDSPDARALESILAALLPALAGRAHVVFDPTLVRGMGYYTGPIFEIGVEGLPYSIAGGGRYDRMIGKLLGREVPACGFSIGFERVIALLLERGVKPKREGKLLALLHEASAEPGAAVAPGGIATPTLASAVAAAAALRAQGHAVSLQVKRRKLGKQLDELQKLGFDGAATLGEDGATQVKWFADRVAESRGGESRAAPERAP